MTREDLEASATKQRWRQWAQELRATLPTESLSKQVVARLLDWPGYQQARHVLVYFAFGSEIDLAELFGDDKEFYATRTWPSFDRGLTIHRIEGDLDVHPFGYRQPKARAPRAQPEDIDVVLVPGLCYDRSGGRLGYGRGYYDRLLADFPPDVPLVGVTSDALVVDALPTTERDVRVTHLATERGIRTVGALGGGSDSAP